MSETNGHQNGNGKANGKQHRRNTVGLKPPWPKGTSGNPEGRPKGSGLTDRLRKLLESEDAQDRLIQAGIDAANDANFNFWKEIFERMDGKVLNRFEGEIRHSAKALPADVIEDIRNAADVE